MCGCFRDSDTETVTPAVPWDPRSYTKVTEMTQRGEWPDDIRDISDEIPNPDQPISEHCMAPKPKLRSWHFHKLHYWLEQGLPEPNAHQPSIWLKEYIISYNRT